jgi:apolipoprotein N-acyltransferase
MLTGVSPSVAAWTLALVAGTTWGLAPTTRLGGWLVVVGALAATRSIRGDRWDAARGALLGVVWYGLALSWLPGAWDRFAGGDGMPTTALVVALQALIPAAAWGVASAFIRTGRVPRPLAIGGATAGCWTVAAVIQPVPAGVSMFLVGAPEISWPAGLVGRAGLDGTLLAVASMPVRHATIAMGGLAVAGLIWIAAPGGSTTSRVGVVQPGTGAFDARRASTADARSTKLLHLVDTLDDPDWVATPEGAWPHDPGGRAGARRQALHDAWQARPPTVLGATPEGRFNSLLVVEGGAVTGRFDKIDRVPVAEHAVLGWGKDRFEAGSEPRWLDIAGDRVGTLICYEDVLPRAVGTTAAEAGVLLAPSNDAWLGVGRGAELHLAASRLAAVESRLWMIRPTASGRSAIIDDHGRLSWHAPAVDGDANPDAPGHATVGEVPIAHRWWSGARVGSWLGLLALLVPIARLGRRE